LDNGGATALAGAGSDAARASFRAGAAGGVGSRGLGTGTSRATGSDVTGWDATESGATGSAADTGVGATESGATGSAAGPLAATGPAADTGAGAGPSLIRAPRPIAEPPRAVSLATRRALRSSGESCGSDAIGPGVTSGWASAFSGSPNSHSKLAGPIPRLSGVIAGAASDVTPGAGAGGAAEGSGERATCTNGCAGDDGRRSGRNSE
jgi:hypothetical protein